MASSRLRSSPQAGTRRQELCSWAPSRHTEALLRDYLSSAPEEARRRLRHDSPWDKVHGGCVGSAAMGCSYRCAAATPTPAARTAHLPAAYPPSLAPRSESVFLEIEGKVRLTPNDTDWMERPEAFACSALGSTTGDQQSKVTISRDLPAVLVPLATISLGTALV